MRSQSPAAFAARPALTNLNDMDRIDVDNAGLANELQPETDWNRRKGPNSRINLRLNEGDRNCPIPRLQKHVSVETSVARRPLRTDLLSQIKAVCDPLDQRRDLEP